MSRALRTLMRTLDARAWPEAQRDAELAADLALVRATVRRCVEAGARPSAHDLRTLTRISEKHDPDSEARRALAASAALAHLLTGQASGPRSGRRRGDAPR
jgi:hypothetical protein